MDSMDAWTTFFGWCAVINIGIYLFAVAAITLFGDWGIRLNARMFKLSEEQIRVMSVTYIANYKLAITMLAVVPWIALKIMA